MTALGDLEISAWREMITELIAYRSEQELQKQLYEWCAEHTPWLHGKSEITDYALECHAARLLMIRFGQIISRLTENTDPMFWIRRS